MFALPFIASGVRTFEVFNTLSEEKTLRLVYCHDNCPSINMVFTSIACGEAFVPEVLIIGFNWSKQLVCVTLKLYWLNSRSPIASIAILGAHSF